MKLDGERMVRAFLPVSLRGSQQESYRNYRRYRGDVEVVD